MIYIVLALSNILAWTWAWIAFAGHPALLGTALLAYVFGLRHAFDADHIAAIDNVVRKLAQEGLSPISTGFFFSLGHSSVVILASVVVASVTAVPGALGMIGGVGGVVGASVSAVFLLVIGISNLLVLRGIWSRLSRLNNKLECADDDIDALMPRYGIISRILRSVFRVVSRSWHMYPVGFLFGLGFDTATEIALLGISATQAAQGLNHWSLLVFPALFTAGMSLMDTIDSVLMTHAYGWAAVNPAHNLWYNLVITAVSAFIAIFIGGVGALRLVGDEFGLSGAPWNIAAYLNEEAALLGFAIAAIFAFGWIVSKVVYRARGY